MNFLNECLNNDGKSKAKTAQQYKIGRRIIQEEKLLSEGGYGYIWKAYDVNTREIFALKKMICQGSERVKLAKNEMETLRKIPYNENLMVFYDGTIIPVDSDTSIALFLLEFLSGGSLFDLMAKNQSSKLEENQIIFIMREIANGLKILHSLNPPIAHRDIKIENVLYHNNRCKLIDFGSCSTEQIDFSTINPQNYYKYEEFYERNTTMMYRPPEMVDLYLKYVVGTKVDIWMMGCVLYTISFFIHPFVDSSKLAISVANYKIPKENKYSEKLKDLIRHMLTPDPRYRPDIHEICNILDNYDRLHEIKLNGMALELKKKAINDEREMIEFEKNLKPIKHFNGDIPEDELYKLKERIEKEGNNPIRQPQKKKPISAKATNNFQPQKNQDVFINKPQNNFSLPKNDLFQQQNNNNSFNFQQQNKNNSLNNQLNEWGSFNNSNSQPQKFDPWNIPQNNLNNQTTNVAWDSFGNFNSFENKQNNKNENNNLKFESFGFHSNDDSNYFKKEPQQIISQPDYSQFFNNNSNNSNNINQNLKQDYKYQNPPANIANANSPPKKTVNLVDDLLGLDPPQKAVQKKQINLLEDLNSLNFN